MLKCQHFKFEPSDINRVCFMDYRCTYVIGNIISVINLRSIFQRNTDIYHTNSSQF